VPSTEASRSRGVTVYARQERVKSDFEVEPAGDEADLAPACQGLTNEIIGNFRGCGQSCDQPARIASKPWRVEVEIVSECHRLAPSRTVSNAIFDPNLESVQLSRGRAS
jgi:hypothetical protein